MFPLYLKVFQHRCNILLMTGLVIFDLFILQTAVTLSLKLIAVPYSKSTDVTCNCLRPATLLKKRLWHRCFLVNFSKFLRTPFLTETPPVAAFVKSF